MTSLLQLCIAHFYFELVDCLHQLDYRKGFVAGTTNPLMKETCSHDVYIDLASNQIIEVDKSRFDSPNKRNPTTKDKFKVFGKTLFDETAKLLQIE